MGDTLLERIAYNIIQGRLEAEDEGFDEGLEGQPGVTELVREALDSGIEPKTIVSDALTASMEQVGRKYEAGEYLIPDMLAAAECVGAAMDMLGPHLAEGEDGGKGKFVIATVAGDLHDIGKNIVVIMLKGAGYDVIDLGTDVKSEAIIAELKKTQAPFLGLSALLTTTMREMESIIQRLTDEGLRAGVKVLIGGAPTSREFAEKIGADAHCRDAFEAIDALKRIAA